MNLLIHAYHSGSPDHLRARAWWEGVLSSAQPVGLAWVVLLGFTRLTTQRVLGPSPWSVSAACGVVRSWLAQPQVLIVSPGSRHVEILCGLLDKLGTAGNLTTDAHLAALAIEHQAELHSADMDFGRFPGLRWHNPLRGSL